MQMTMRKLIACRGTVATLMNIEILFLTEMPRNCRYISGFSGSAILWCTLGPAANSLIINIAITVADFN